MLYRQSRGDDVGHVVLKGEHVAEIALEAIGPDDPAGFHVAQLDVDPQPAALPLQTAVHEVADAQLGADHLGRHARLLEQEGRMARDHQKVAKPAEIGDDVCRDAIAQMGVARIAGQIGERQHGDGGLGQRRDRLAV